LRATSMPKYFAPAGTPIPTRVLMKWLAQSLSGKKSIETFRHAIEEKFHTFNCQFISSGRTALYLALRDLRTLAPHPGADEVIIPSYTCYSVPGSVEKAGLKIRVCDIDPGTLSYDLDALNRFDFSKVLAIVSSNLYGFPNDLPAITNIAKQHNVFFIDDAAQSMGAMIADQYAGTYGDVGIYSLDKGKNITSIQGGIVVSNHAEFSQVFDETVNSLPLQSSLSLMADTVKLCAYSLLLPPRYYWIAAKLLSLGTTPYTTDYPVHAYSEVMANMAFTLFEDLDKINSRRIHNAEYMIQTLEPYTSITPIHPVKQSKPVYLRLPLLISDNRNQIVDKLNAAGIGATTSYPEAIINVPQLRNSLDRRDLNCPGGCQVAKEIVTLPTQAYMNQQSLDKTIDILISS